MESPVPSPPETARGEWASDTVQRERKGLLVHSVILQVNAAETCITELGRNKSEIPQIDSDETHNSSML